MTNPVSKNETGLMRIFFCIFIIISTVITFTINEISGIPFYFVKSFEILISCGAYGFAFLIGYRLAIHDLPDTFKGYFKVFKKRVIPFLYAIVVYWLIKLLVGDAELKPIALFRLTYSYHFYILLVALQLLVLTMLFGKQINKFNPCIFVGVCALVHITLDFLLSAKIYKYIFIGYILCFSVGFCTGKNYDAFKNFVLKKFKKAVFAYACFFALTIIVFILLGFKKDPVMRSMNTIMLSVNTCLACVFTAALSIRMCKNPTFYGKTAKLLADSSYLVYLWHTLPVIAVHNILLTSEDISKLEGVLYKLVSALSVAITVIIVVYINKKRREKDGTV